MEHLFTVAALVLIVIFVVMVAYTLYASVKANRRRDTRLNQIQRRLAEIEAEKEKNSQ